MMNSPSIEQIDSSTPIKDPSIPLDKNIKYVQKVLADNVITSNAKQFVSAEEKAIIHNMIDGITGTTRKIMYKDMYDRDNDGIVDVSKKALVADVVLWDNVLGRPNIPVTKITTTVDAAHTHPNLDILDKIGVDSNNNLTFDNHSIKLPDTLMDMSDYDIDQDGVIDKALYAESTTWDGIHNKPLFYTPSPHTHMGSDIDGAINATMLNGIDGAKYVTKDDKIGIDKIDGLNTLKVVLDKINGGNASSEFDGTEDETKLIMRHDRALHMQNMNPVLDMMELGYETDTYRHKIGNGLTPWNGLPYEYNTPASIRFNTFARNFITRYINYEDNFAAQVSVSGGTVPNPQDTIMYCGMARGYNDCMVAIPFNAKNVYYCDANGAGQTTFGAALENINTRGQGWLMGATYKNRYVYCAPYNSDKVLKIDTKDKTIDPIDVSYIPEDVTRGKYCNATLGIDNKVYFVPNNSDGIMEFDPMEDRAVKYQNKAIFDIDSSHCAAVTNPLDNMIYFMPKKNNKIVQFDPIDKTMRVVALVNDYGTMKFSTAVLAPNGKIYCIPSYGYMAIAVFDPNTYTVEYIPFETSSFAEYKQVVVAPNNKLYMIPAGAGSSEVIEFNMNTNAYMPIYRAEVLLDRWCGGILNSDGFIICLPYTSVNLLKIKLRLKAQISSDILNGVFANN